MEGLHEKHHVPDGVQGREEGRCVEVGSEGLVNQVLDQAAKGGTGNQDWAEG